MGLEEIHRQITAPRCHGLLPVLCSAISLFATWVVRRWWKFLSPATAMEGVDYATLGSAFDRINSENNSLRREVSSLNGALSELFSVVGRLREDLDGITADHDRLAEQVGWQHVGMVRLGRFQSLSERVNPTKAASFCPGETEHDGIPRYGPGRVYVNSSSPG